MNAIPRAGMRLRERRLGPKLLAAIVLASSCLALFATGIQLYLDYSRDLGEIDAQFLQIENSYVDSLANSLWSVDKSQIRLQLNGLLKMRDVQFARVEGKLGERFEAGLAAKDKVMVRSYVLHAPNAAADSIGTLTVGIGLSGVYARLWDRALVILATQATKTFLIALFILFIVSQWVTRHLEHMARHARSLNSATLDRPLALRRPGGAKPDELDEVAQALNDMSLRLADEHAQNVDAQAELRRHRDHLEELVTERTAELKVAKERAEAASAAKSEFLSRMSHELRTPLNAILGYAQIMQLDRGLNEDRRAAAVDTIRTSGEHLLTLIVDILDLSRIEAGKAQLYPASVDPAVLLRGVADIIRIKAEEKGLAFGLQAEGLPAAIQVDEKRLRQVLLNLLGNAVKFTDRGEVRLAVHARDVEPGQAVLSFAVHDSGVGLAPEHLERIFQPFEQAGDVHRRHGGTGLGLAISRQLVRLMGGDIRVESVPGRGSLFAFDIVVPVSSPVDAPAPPARRMAGYDGPVRRVLVVDDVPGNRLMLSDMLGAVGFEVEQAFDGEQALACVAAHAPDLVVMDVAMPRMDGLEATRRLRLQAATRALPVIAVSANASNVDRQACLDAGANAFVSKPVDRDALLREIGEQLALRWRHDAAALNG